jgi:hypothetical protein
VLFVNGIFLTVSKIRVGNKKWMYYLGELIRKFILKKQNMRVWPELFKERVQWRALAITAVNLQVPQTAGISLPDELLLASEGRLQSNSYCYYLGSPVINQSNIQGNNFST